MDFDKQAPSYDQRVGLPPAVAQKVARAVVGLPQKSSILKVLEIGAGTGEIGCEIAKLVQQYIAMDSSAGMLEQFRLRCQNQQVHATLIKADGNEQWPVEPGQVNVIFGSRALHLLNFEHLTKELKRLSQHDRVWLIIGNVKKAPESIPFLMRKKMRELLKAQGIAGRSGKKLQAQLSQFFAERGMTVKPKLQVATWQREDAPVHALDSWRSKSGLAGIDIPRGVKNQILNQVEAWAIEYFGDIHKKQPTTYHYELNAIQIHGQ